MRNKGVNNSGSLNQPGIVLLVTLVLLVVLATLGYTLSSRVAAQRHRDQYIIDYSQARYGCDSAVKYALATLQELNPQLISRPNEPDFSDLFALSQAEYQQLLAPWTAENATDMKDINDTNDVDYVDDINDINDIDRDELGYTTIRGPYGPAWPFVTEPVEFEVGSATIRIEIEDENAKYPIGWMLLSEPEVQREATAGFEMFCEWMGLGSEQTDSLKDQLKQISQIKPFKLEFKPIKQTVRIPAAPRTTTSSAKSSKRTIRRTSRPRVTTKTITVSDQMAKQNADFTKLLHSSLIDTEVLARPYIEGRKESALKYMGMWASRKVNINTAPRHVLEAAFAFGGISDAPKIAEQIIQRRRLKPFTDIEDLKQELLRYSDSIKKCEKYITTTSRFFTIKVTAISGVAKASATIAITKDGQKVKRIAIISD
ncbi:MAG: type II secretion system protein GspK [Sedimentisphaerales bacterium]